MSGLGWVWGRVLLYDLSDRSARVLRLPRETYRLLYGGRGLAAFLIYHYAGSPEPLAPGNPLVIAPGLLVGTGLSTASKTILAARSPLTGLLGRSSVGARLGAMLRLAGFDALVITGALDEPGVLVVDEEGARVEPAGRTWGLTVSRSREELRRRFPGYSGCLIGPAGESLSRIAMVDCDGRQAGRTGLGAVMGAKKLKAVLARGRRKPVPARPERLRRLVVEWARHVPSTSSSKALVEYGTPIVVGLTEPQGVFPGRNWTRSTLSWCPDREKAREDYMTYGSRSRVGRAPCIYCNRPCSQVTRARDPARGAEREIDGPEYELLYSLGSNLGFCSPKEAASLALLADELGFDGISLGTTLAWLLEAVERGIVGGDMLQPYPGLGWGRLEPLARLVEDMAYRRTPLASLLAEGEARASRVLGGEDLAVHVKGLGLPAYDARGLKGLALGYAVSSRGGDHLTSGMYAVELGGKLWIYEGVDPLSYEGKPAMVKAMEDLFTAYDNLGVCKFSRKELPPGRLAEAVEAVLGVPTGPGDVLLSGERTVMLERLLNLRWGLEPEMDTLPPRLTKDPISDGPRRGETVSPDRLKEMVRDYYLLRGWSPGRGEPLRETLEILGLAPLLEQGAPTAGGGPQ